ncbi:MAG: hypothetical protein ACREAA_06010 [Candidatus Polarisedimenticolia bacterium]
MNLLFVCTANLHRSPLAATLMAALLEKDGRSDVTVASAGLRTVDGLPALPEACDLAREMDGIDLSAHRSRRLTAGLLSEADVILVMEADQLLLIEEIDAGSARRARLLGDYAEPGCGIAPGEDVPDFEPGEPASFQRSHDVLSVCVKRLYRSLEEIPQEVYAASVERLFRERTGGTLSLAPADWDRIDGWWRRGVPLWIVLDSLRETMHRTGGRGDGRRMRRLSYCAPAVEDRYTAWTRSREGSRQSAAGAPHLPSGLQAAVETLRAAAHRAREAGLASVAEALDQCAGEAEAIPSPSAPTDERLLLDQIDERLSERLREAAGEILRNEVRDDAVHELAIHRERMSPKAFDATVARLADRRLRSRLGVPDLHETLHEV